MRTLSKLWDLFCSAFFCESAIFQSLTISMDLIYFSGFEVQCWRKQPHGFCSPFTQFQKLFSYAIYDMDRESGNVLLASLKSFIAWDLIIEECSCTSERKTFYHHTSYSLCFFPLYFFSVKFPWHHIFKVFSCWLLGSVWNFPSMHFTFVEMMGKTTIETFSCDFLIEIIRNHTLN